MSTKTLCRSRSTLAFPTKTDFKTEKELLEYYYESRDAHLALLQAVRQEQGNMEAIVYLITISSIRPSQSTPIRPKTT
jgi:hypothetical protein